MIELLSTETKPVYIGYNKLAADVAEATTDALTGADYIALQATIKYLANRIGNFNRYIKVKTQKGEKDYEHNK